MPQQPRCHRLILGLVSLGLMAGGVLIGGLAQAATITDTFDLKLTFKEWCQGNPTFFENFTIKIDSKNPSINTTLTITRDDSTPTDIQAKIDTLGGSADVDAITLSGRTMLGNISGNRAEFALSGVNPSSPNHFLTLRGQATLDKFGNLTKVTGTFMLQETNTYTTDKQTGSQSGPVECFASGTFTTGKEVGGTLIVSNAPASTGGTFVANAYLTTQKLHNGMLMDVLWQEAKENKVHNEAVGLLFDINAGYIFLSMFMTQDPPNGPMDWACGASVLFPISECAGMTVNRSAGTLTFSNTVLDGFIGTSAQITLNGTLTFRPF